MSFYLLYFDSDISYEVRESWLSDLSNVQDVGNDGALFDSLFLRVAGASIPDKACK